MQEILVVDDNPANLGLLDILLKSKGYKVRPVTGGVSALQAAKSSPPDLIMLDINMPDLNGYEVCKRLKADEVLKDIPVLFISALDNPLDKIKAFECGGLDYITKPFWMDEVLARVTTHLNLRRLQLDVEMHNARLEESVRIRTREITEARDQLVEANARLAILDKTKSDFLSLISHELRTPLNGLFGITELILHECHSLPSMEELYELFNQSREKILTILEDSLLLTQIDVEGGKFACTAVSLSSVLLKAKESVLDFAKSYHVDIGPIPIVSETVIGKPDLLIKALEALLETAVRFSKPGSDINISISTMEAEILMAIETKGHVIPEKWLPRFFDVLSIGEAIVPGGDLGLRPAVAERIISLFGGSVTVENLNPIGIRLNVRLKSVRQPQPNMK